MTGNILENIYVALDLETTGLHPESDAIFEVGAVKFRNGVVIDTFQSLINPYRPIPYNIQRLCNISQSDVKHAPSFDQISAHLEAFIDDHSIVGHNIAFDLNFLSRQGIGINNSSCDTLDLARLLLPGVPERSLSTVADYLGIPHSAAHRALADAQMSREIFIILINKLIDMDISVLTELQRLSRKERWWLGDLIEQLCFQRGPTLLVGEAGLEKACFGSGIARHKDILSPNEEISQLNVKHLVDFFNNKGAIARHFPNYEPRPQQVEMMRSVADALNNKSHLIVEAGTGTGKSMAYLLPTAFFASRNNLPVVISTNTINLQEQLVNKDVPDLLRALGPESEIADIQVTPLKGRNNYLCIRRWQTMRKSDHLSLEAIQLLSRIQVWLPATSTGDRAEVNIDAREIPLWNRICAQSYDCLGKKCPYQIRGLCFLHRARKTAQSSHLIIVNHALLLSELEKGSQILPPYTRLIIDEAHHLEEVATSQLGVEIKERDIDDYLAQIFQESDGHRTGIAPYLQYLAGAGGFERNEELREIAGIVVTAAARIKNRASEFYIELGSLLQNLGEGQSEYDLNMRITPAVRAQPGWSEVEICCENLMVALGEMSKLIRKIDGMIEDASIPETLRFEILTLINLTDEYREQLDQLIFHPNDNTIAWISMERRNSMIALHSAPLHVGSILSTRLYARMDTLVLTGATLSTEGHFDYLKGRLGFHQVNELRLDSPFDYQSSALVYIVSDIPEPGASGYQDALGNALVSLGSAMKGRLMVLFTSHTALKAVKEAIGSCLMEEDILVLGQGIDGSPRKLLASLQENNRTVVLGAASFWEGVDVAGDALSVLAMVRLPFNVPSDPVFAARSEKFGNPFGEYALPQAAFKFKQGFGRLIRSKTDRGILVVLDSRLSNKRYGRTFLNSLPKCSVKKGSAEKLPDVIEQWFGDSFN